MAQPVVVALHAALRVHVAQPELNLFNDQTKTPQKITRSEAVACLLELLTQLNFQRFPAYWKVEEVFRCWVRYHDTALFRLQAAASAGKGCPSGGMYRVAGSTKLPSARHLSHYSVVPVLFFVTVFFIVL